MKRGPLVYPVGSVEEVDIEAVPRNVFVSSNPDYRLVKNLQLMRDKNHFYHKDFKPHFLNDKNNEYLRKLKVFDKKNCTDIYQDDDILNHMIPKQSSSTNKLNYSKKLCKSHATEARNTIR